MNNYIKNSSHTEIVVAITGAVPIRNEGDLPTIKEVRIPPNSTCNVWTIVGYPNHLYLLDPVESKVGTGILDSGKTRYVSVYSYKNGRYNVDFEKASRKLRNSLKHGDKCIQNMN
ncbi:hypothetical protein [Marinibactrum halimedae]|uniref:Uncharacterized protein n=1 Tax=Marinibactrum halimedae TaxID=1444977 RepID=A0AA37WMM5_9GAMM|nr:hypothetical protein [Marinibactrum halimedae]MCD9461364.1 hypothetical protein [Marinibactrum halimedae]GLS26435.1 hypothetical protein GCM10007877_21510 [Marinibactrum halimedae]